MPDFYRAFFTALREPRSAHPAGITAGGGFEVYRNNVHSGLVNALAEAFPVVLRLVGAEFFRAMAAEFVHEELPVTPVLLEYGDSFAAFVDGFEPAAGLPYLGDVARLEWARQQAYHAADAEPLDPQRLAAIDPAQLDRLRLQAHPSLQLCESRWPVLDIWATNARDDDVRGIDLAAGGQQLLVLRPHAGVTEQILPAGGFRFLQAMTAGRTLAESTRAGLTEAAEFNLAGMLQLLLQAGALADFRSADDEPAMRTGGDRNHD